MEKSILLVIIIIMVQGCGTIRTLNPASDHVEIHYKGHKSHCKNIPRIYSGTFNDACLLFGEPNYKETGDSTESAFYLLMIDGLLSFGLDTVFLPYTAIRQFKDGNISVN